MMTRGDPACRVGALPSDGVAATTVGGQVPSVRAVRELSRGEPDDDEHPNVRAGAAPQRRRMVRAGRRPSCGGLLTTGGRPHPLATDRRTNASCRVQRPPMTPDAPNGCRRMVRGHVMPDCEASIACRAGAGDPGHHRPSISSICRRTISVRTSAGTGRSTVKRIVPFHRPYPRATVSRSRRSSTGLSERLAGRVDGHLATFATSRPDAWQRSTATQRLHAIPPDPPNVTAPARPTLPCPGTHECTSARNHVGMRGR
jgi:hypothetical protein